ncbi:MAG: hypothetical protein WDO73_37040 [Ignavibacteriota bacterium]
MKSYFANSFRVAMEQARKEMGPDAMLVTTRTSALESRHLGEYEVVFAADLEPAPTTAPPMPKEPSRVLPPTAPGQFTKAVFPQLPASAPQPPSPDLQNNLGDMRRAAAPGSFPKPTFPQIPADAPPPPSRELQSKFDETRRAAAPGPFPRPTFPQIPAEAPPTPSPELQSKLDEMRRQIKTGRRGRAVLTEDVENVPVSYPTKDLVAELIQREVTPEIAHLLVSTAENRARTAGLDRSKFRTAVWEEIQDAFQVESRLTAEGTGPIVLALVGPPGAGKTATIAKLAVRHGLTARKPAVLISLDTLRVGASEQLRCYASLLGLAFQTVETNRALEQSLEEHRTKELILIDTPGFTLSDLNAGCEAAEFLARRSDIVKHLVLPASMRFADLTRMSVAYDIFQPSRSIFTRLDETESYGAVLNETIQSGRPIAFFCDGQRVPEDLAEATNRGLANLILPSTEASATQYSGARPVDTFQSAA